MTDAPTTTPRPLLDINQVATILNVTPFTVRAYIRKGFIEPVRLGYTLRFRPEDIEKIVSEGF